MSFDIPLMFLSFIVGPIFFLAGAILYAFPPKKKNAWYGYRTESSMQSQRNWNFAQTYASKVLIIMSMVYTGLTYGMVYIPMTNTTGLAIGIISLILMCIAIYLIVENRLKGDIDED